MARLTKVSTATKALQLLEKAAPLAGKGRYLAQAAMKSAGLGAVVDGVIGGVEATLAYRQGADAELCQKHVVSKVTGGFVVGGAAGLAGMGAVLAFGPGMPALVVGALAASGASRLYHQVAGPAPLADWKEKHRAPKKKRRAQPA